MTPQLAILYVGLPPAAQRELDAVRRLYESLRCSPSMVREAVSARATQIREAQR